MDQEPDHTTRRLSSDPIGERLDRMRRLTKDGRDLRTKSGISLRLALFGTALLGMLFGSIRMLFDGNKLGFTATPLIGIAACYAVAIVAMRHDRELFRRAVWIAVGYASIIVLCSLFIALWLWH